MKKLLVLISLVFCCSVISYAKCEKAVGLNHHPMGGTHAGSTKNPVLPWIIDLTNNIISMEATPCDYTLNLYDEDEAVVYSVFVPAGTTQVVLPTTLSGSFELRFETDTYYYYGFIYL